MTQHWSVVLGDANACSDALNFAKLHRSFSAAWAACERPDWLLWWAAKCIGEPGSVAHRKLVRVACACAATALKHVPKGETRPAEAIRVTRAWCAGKATLDEVRDAAAAASAAADAAAAYAAAADAAAAAADAAAAYAAAADAAAAAYAAARASARSRLCRLIRRHYPTPPQRRAKR